MFAFSMWDRAWIQETKLENKNYPTVLFSTKCMDIGIHTYIYIYIRLPCKGGQHKP